MTTDIIEVLTQAGVISTCATEAVQYHQHSARIEGSTSSFYLHSKVLPKAQAKWALLDPMDLPKVLAEFNMDFYRAHMFSESSAAYLIYQAAKATLEQQL